MTKHDASGNTKSTIMVTGGSGLVGQAIESFTGTHKLPDVTWTFLNSKDGDLQDRGETYVIFEWVKPTHVIHLAAKVGGLLANMKHKVSYIMITMMCIFEGEDFGEEMEFSAREGLIRML